jgi:hypothetical protein
MQACEQTKGQSILQHGISVKEHIFQLIDYLKTGEISGEWRLPEWLSEYREQILSVLLPQDIIEEYTIYHDCGKPYCKSVDENGRIHFPNHADTSYNTWLSVGGSNAAAKLMKMDMMIHTMKACDIDEFITHPEACTLLLAGLAEIHSNAKMFGGYDSTSFKIKWNQINKRGKVICQKLFRSSNVSIA